ATGKAVLRAAVRVRVDRAARAPVGPAQWVRAWRCKRCRTVLHAAVDADRGRVRGRGGAAGGPGGLYIAHGQFAVHTRARGVGLAEAVAATARDSGLLGTLVLAVHLQGAVRGGGAALSADV